MIPRRRAWQPSILAWRILWTEEPGELWFIGFHQIWTRLKRTSTHTCRFYSGLLILFHWCIYLSYANSHWFCYCSFVILIGLKSGSEDTPVLFIFKFVLAVHGPLRFHKNFKMGFSVSARKVFGDFKRDYIVLSHTDILTVLNLLICEHGICFYLCFLWGFPGGSSG